MDLVGVRCWELVVAVVFVVDVDDRMKVDMPGSHIVDHVLVVDLDSGFFFVVVE